MSRWVPAIGCLLLWSAATPGCTSDAGGGHHVVVGCPTTRVFGDCADSGTSIDAASRGVPLWKSCVVDSECGPGFCLYIESHDILSSVIRAPSYCSQVCTTDADCPSSDPQTPTSCGVGPNGSRVCMQGVCPRADTNTVCQDGLVTACDAARQTFCGDCGCLDGTRCEPGVGCFPLSDVGGPCIFDRDCLSFNCDSQSKKCFVGVGQPCTPNNCELCIGVDQQTFCTKGCSGDVDCGPAAFCMPINGSPDVFKHTVCVPQCNSYCPGGCDSSDIARPPVCPCAKCLLAAGSLCFVDIACMSNACTNNQCE